MLYVILLMLLETKCTRGIELLNMLPCPQLHNVVEEECSLVRLLFFFRELFPSYLHLVKVNFIIICNKHAFSLKSCYFHQHYNSRYVACPLSTTYFPFYIHSHGLSYFFDASILFF